MIKSSVEQLAKAIGEDIGASDDRTQAELLNGFCDSLYRLCMGATQNLDTQLCYVAHKLTPRAREVINALNEFCKLEES